MGKLNDIAAEMMSKPRAYRVLARGLAISWEAAEDRRRLALGRLAPAWPSDHEQEIVRAAFAVPDAVEPESDSVRHLHRKSKIASQYNVINFSWREYETASAGDNKTLSAES